MAFISHAQNYEDVMLWRALRDVEQGFWIDVGAADPAELSVTKAFSERGWRGINIDPEPSFAAQLREQRPHDINLQVAVGRTRGSAVLHTLFGLSTLQPQIAERHAAAGLPVAVPLEVEMRTLADICEEFAQPDIHFLKVDVEGSEAEVLLGADFTRFRPWIIVMEATAPLSPIKDTSAFEGILAAAGYAECYFDGLNAFYVAAEHEARLRPLFAAPPNYFDEFVRAEEAKAGARVQGLERDIAERDVALAQARHDAEAAQARVQGLERDIAERNEALVRVRNDAVAARVELGKIRARLAASGDTDARHAAEAMALVQAMRRSTSWRITAPLRAFRHILDGNPGVASVGEGRGDATVTGPVAVAAQEPSSAEMRQREDGSPDPMRSTLRRLVVPIARPIWRRVWARVEQRVGPIEDRISATDARLASLEMAWRTHVPAFLNAVGTVGAFGHELQRAQAEIQQLRRALADAEMRMSHILERENAPP